jgi:hypothetical protein
MSDVTRQQNEAGNALEMLPVTELCREVGGVSANTLRRTLRRHGILGDAVLVENGSRSELFSRARVPQIKKLIERNQT